MDKLPEGYIKTDTRGGWKRGSVFIWATGFDPPQWLCASQGVSIRPKETGAEAYQRETGQPLPKNTFVFERDM